MIQYWKERGVNKVIHNGQDRENAWISYIPENLANTGELYPVFLDYHGGAVWHWCADFQETQDSFCGYHVKENWLWNKKNWQFMWTG